jgi:citrate lyase subunit beta/citryl-CoA lyase
MAFGSIDFALDIAADHDDPALLLARSTLVLASRAAGLPAPVDGVTSHVHDTVKVTTDARRSRALGFGGKLCIHPAQIGPVAEAFAPSAAEVAWAREVVSRAVAAQGGAIEVHGQMIDRPMLSRAERLLAAASSPS